MILLLELGCYQARNGQPCFRIPGSAKPLLDRITRTKTPQSRNVRSRRLIASLSNWARTVCLRVVSRAVLGAATVSRDIEQVILRFTIDRASTWSAILEPDSATHPARKCDERAHER